jgi:putative transposase
MHFIEGLPYHIYNRGTNKQLIFFSESNYSYFLEKVRKAWAPFCTMEKHCLMPNHFHFICIPNHFGCEHILQMGAPCSLQRFSRAIGHALSRYTCAINRERNRTGVLFQKKTRCKLLLQEHEKGRSSRDYYATCGDYIEQNPVTAGLVLKAEDWRWSSASDKPL